METKELIKSLGETLGVELTLDDGGTCAFEADELFVKITDLPENGVIIIEGDIGAPPPENLEALYKTMLEAQYCFRNTSGATISRNPDTGNFVLCRAIAAEIQDPASFLDAVERFVSTLHVWADIVRNYRGAASDKPPTDDLSAGGFMRV